MHAFFDVHYKQTLVLSRILESYTFTNNLFIYWYFLHRAHKVQVISCIIDNFLTTKRSISLTLWSPKQHQNKYWVHEIVQPQLNGLLLEVLSLTFYSSHPNIFGMGISLSNSHSNISGLKHGEGDSLLFLATIKWSGKSLVVIAISSSYVFLEKCIFYKPENTEVLWMHLLRKALESNSPSCF